MKWNEAPCGKKSIGHKIGHKLGIHMVSTCHMYWLDVQLDYEQKKVYRRMNETLKRLEEGHEIK